MKNILRCWGYPTTCTTYLAIVLLPYCVDGQVHAADIHWSGRGSDAWQNVDNWQPFGSPFSVHRVPADGDTAPFNGLTVGNGIELRTNGSLLEVDNDGAAETVNAESSSTFVDSGSRTEFRTANLIIDRGVLIAYGLIRIEGSTEVSGNEGRLFTLFGSVPTIQFGGDVPMHDGVVAVIYAYNSSSFAANSSVLVEHSRSLTLLTRSNPIPVSQSKQLRIESGSLFEITGGDLIVGGGSDGTLLVDGPGTKVAFNATSFNNPEVEIGHASAGTGLVRVSNAANFKTLFPATINSGTLKVDGGTYRAVARMLVDGGTFTLTSGNPIHPDSVNFMFTAEGESRVQFDVPLTIGNETRDQLQSGGHQFDSISFADSGSLDLTGGNLSVRNDNGNQVNPSATLSPGGPLSGSPTGDTAIAANYTQHANGSMKLEVDDLGMGANYDFLLIQRGDSSLIPPWESQFGSGAPLASSRVVPEPATG